MKIVLSNRQRKVNIDMAWLESRAGTLAGAVLDSFKKNKVKHLKRALLEEMRTRGSLSLVLASNQQIRKINKEWRGQDKATDVISFPLSMMPPPVELPWEIGELVISLEKAQEQAKDYGHSFERELSFLFVHGLLHVLGFDHETPKEEKEMFSRQHEVLASLGISR